MSQLKKRFKSSTGSEIEIVRSTECGNQQDERSTDSPSFGDGVCSKNYSWKANLYKARSIKLLLEKAFTATSIERRIKGENFP